MSDHSDTCLHCNAPTSHHSPFCCNGCEMVYHLIQNHNLGHFYHLKGQGSSLSTSDPVRSRHTDYTFLDEPDAQKRFVLPGHPFTMSFYLEGIHCSACIWLIEKLDQINPDVDSISLNFGTSIVTVTRKKEGLFSSIASSFEQLGYTPHPLDDLNAVELRKKETRSSLLKIGIAGACMGNIMLFTIPRYAGLVGSLGTLFDWISSITFLPVLFFSALPFYQGAFRGIKQRHFNIDITVSLAFVLGGAWSYINLIRGIDAYYFDSLAMFCFLLLSSRYFYKKAFESIYPDKLQYAAFIPTYVEINQKKVSTESLKLNQIIVVNEGDIIPVDGIVVSDTAYVDAHILNGESSAVVLKKGELIFAGMKNVGECISISVTSVGAHTRLGKMLHDIQSYQKPRSVQRADTLARFLLKAIIVMAILLLWIRGLDGVNSVLALIILGCPCALSLAMPLTFLHAINIASEEGVCIKNPDIFEKIGDIKTVFLDKTGTLTEGQLSLFSSLPHEKWIRDMIYSMEKNVQHPIASAIRRAFEGASYIPLEDVVYDVGKGVSARYGDKRYILRGVENEGKRAGILTTIGLFDEQDICHEVLQFRDGLQPKITESIAWLKQHGYHPILLSGDSQSAVTAVANEVGIQNYYYRCEPEDKVSYCQKIPCHIMVGDGANDALSLSKAYVSIAVRGALDVSLNVSDIYFRKPGIQSLPFLLKLTKQTNMLVMINYGVAFFFNAIGVILVFINYVTPLVAAVLMPLSSVSIFLISRYTRWSNV